MPTTVSEVEKYTDEKDFIEIDFPETEEHVEEVTHDEETDDAETHVAGEEGHDDDTESEESHDEAEGDHSAGHGMGFAMTFLWIAVILLFAKFVFQIV